SAQKFSISALTASLYGPLPDSMACAPAAVRATIASRRCARPRPASRATQTPPLSDPRSCTPPPLASRASLHCAPPQPPQLSRKPAIPHIHRAPDDLPLDTAVPERSAVRAPLPPAHSLPYRSR